MFLMIIYWHLLLLYSQGKGSVNVRCDSFPKLNLRLWKDYGVNDCKLRVVDKGACCRSKLFSNCQGPHVLHSLHTVQNPFHDASRYQELICSNLFWLAGECPCKLQQLCKHYSDSSQLQRFCEQFVMCSSFHNNFAEKKTVVRVFCRCRK